MYTKFSLDSTILIHSSSLPNPTADIKTYEDVTNFLNALPQSRGQVTTTLYDIVENNDYSSPNNVSYQLHSTNGTICSCFSIQGTSDDPLRHHVFCHWAIENPIRFVSIALSTFSVAVAVVGFGVKDIIEEGEGENEKKKEKNENKETDENDGEKGKNELVKRKIVKKEVKLTENESDFAEVASQSKTVNEKTELEVRDCVILKADTANIGLDQKSQLGLWSKSFQGDLCKQSQNESNVITLDQENETNVEATSRSNIHCS